MLYYYIPEQKHTRHGDLVEGELVTVREHDRDPRAPWIREHGRLVDWPKNKTFIFFGVRFRSRVSGCLEIRPNGDPFGSGFNAIELEFPSDDVGVYRGDLGDQTLAWWKEYANAHNYILIREG